ncbi:MAG: hypothetical protein KAZ87_06905 [Spirochaetes bacterium]|nr:hypothetical protein [Spirochaetota bacterium]
MLWHFKKTKYLYLGLCFSGMIAAAAVAFRIRFTPNIDISFEHGYVVLFGLILWIILSGLICTFYAMKDRFKIQNIIFNDCDPLKCISELEKIIDTKKLPKTYSNCFFLDLVWALLADGKTEEAFEVIKRIRKLSRDVKEKMSYYSYLVSIYLLQNNLEDAETVLNRMKETMDNVKLSKFDKAFSERIYDRTLCVYGMAHGRYDGAEDYFISEFVNAGNRYNKVIAKLNLGKIYLHYNKIAEAEEAFEYVLSNGNRLAAVKTAEEYLNKISKKRALRAK